MRTQESDMKSAINACLNCRRVKMKCYAGDVPLSKCQRCSRKSLDCVFREHRRGRKPGTRSLTQLSPSRSTSEALPAARIPESPAPEAAHHQALSHESRDDPTTNDLQPSGVLNRHAMRGRFSLHDLLVSSDSEGQIAIADGNELGSDDPITLGLLNVPIAKSLYDSFILVLNPFISQLDPTLHAFAYTRRKSAFLLTAILTASAKAFHPALYQRLYQHSQDLFTNVFRHGSKSVEIVQAILILTYWKEPSDTRVWTSVGYAIRICMDMGFHRQTQAAEDPGKSDVDRRETRNIERTWLVLFVYDRSLSLQTGKPFMINSDRLIESVETWARHPLSIENDRLLAALVTLRLETSAAFTFMIPQSNLTGQQHGFDPLLSILRRRIDHWESVWAPTDASEKDDETRTCHDFLIPFYGNHLRLQLFSLQLHAALSPSNLDSLWIAYSSALRMLRLIPQHSNHLSFAQDSIHVMLAYSAGFLSKLLHLAPRSISEELQMDVVAAMRNASATVCSLVSMSSSCALQSRYLDKLLIQLTSRAECPNLATDGRQSSAPELQPSLLSELTGGLDGHLDFFPDNGNWDDIFASAGLVVERDSLGL